MSRMTTKYVNLEDLLSGLPRSGAMTTSAARALAHDILDACEAVDPTEEESEWERHAANQARETADIEMREVEINRGPTVDPGALAKAIHAALGSRGLAIRQPSPHCIQVMQGRKVFAEWWPGKGTTMHRQARGPRCADSGAFVRWLRTLVA